MPAAGEGGLFGPLDPPGDGMEIGVMSQAVLHAGKVS